VSAVEAPAVVELLPAVHRLRDAERDGALEALLSLLDAELERMRDDVDGLYDNWFIETCAEWVVPYIGDLLGVQGLRDLENARFSQRGLIANTIGYRRRKGTAGVLEDLARDVSGWPARVVEYFSLLGWTQYVNHVRPGGGGIAALRSGSSLELIDTPFDESAHTADVRHIDLARGRHNIPHLGIFLWRLGAFMLERTRARAMPGLTGCYRFNPLGLDTPLFNVERPERDVAHLAAEPNVPGPVRRRALHDELSGAASGEDRYFARVDPVLRVWRDGVELKPAELAVCRLDPPDRPIPTAAKAAVDPELGRIAVPGATTATEVEASWAYGFAGELGGGPYDRTASVGGLFAAEEAERRIGDVTWQRGVWGHAVAADLPSPNAPSTPTGVFTDLNAAVAHWDAGPFKQVGLIAIMDSRTYSGADLTIRIPGGSTLILAAGDWPDEDPSAARSAPAHPAEHRRQSDPRPAGLAARKPRPRRAPGRGQDHGEPGFPGAPSDRPLHGVARS
jgi:hypothetical protein